MSKHWLAALALCCLSIGCNRKGPTGAEHGNPTVGGAIQAVKGAAKRTVDANDLSQLQIFIENASGASGRMPDKNTIMAALKQEAPKIHQAILDGTLVLTGTTNREGVWAYAAEALNTNGFVVTSAGTVRMTASELKQRLQGN